MEILKLLKPGLSLEDMLGADWQKANWTAEIIALVLRVSQLLEPLLPFADVWEEKSLGVHSLNQETDGVREAHVQRVPDTFKIRAVHH